MRVLVASLVLASGLAAADPTRGPDGYTAGPGGRPMLGIEMSPVPLNVQTREQIAVDQGVYVRQVFPDTAAANMGLRPGDVVLTVNNQPIGSMSDLRNEVGLSDVGQPVQVVVARNGERMEVAGQIRPWPQNIPYDAIDPAVEERFRDWQKRRVERQQQEVDQLAQQIDEMRRDLDSAKDANPWTKAQAFDQLATYLAFLPAWKVEVRDRFDASAFPAPTDVERIGVPVDPSDEAPWRISWRLAPAAD